MSALDVYNLSHHTNVQLWGPYGQDGVNGERGGIVGFSDEIDFSSEYLTFYDVPTGTMTLNSLASGAQFASFASASGISSVMMMTAITAMTFMKGLLIGAS